MDTWRSTYLGLRELPRELTAFEVQTFFTFSIAEREAIAQRRSATHQLGLALHIGFMRMSGRLLDAFRVLPPNLWRHLGEHLGVQAPEVASLRGMYKRGRTLYDHHQVACEVLGFAWMSEGQRRALVRALSDELHRCIDRERLLVFARHWLYERRLIVAHERTLRSTIAAAAKRHEHELAARIGAQVDAPRLAGWRKVPIRPHRSGLTRQTWLWQAPARHSTRQIAEVLERIEFLYELGVQQHLGDVPDLALRRYARRLARRKPSVAARIQEPGRTVGVACFLRYCLLVATDQLILMVRRCVADLWRQAAAVTPDSVNWADLYRQLLGELTQLAGADAVSDSELRTRLAGLVLQNQQRKPPSRAQLIRARLTDAVGPIRSLLAALCKLPWQAQGEHPVVQALGLLRDLYARNKRHLPADVSIRLGPVWRDAITGYDRERAFRALEVATLFALRRALRNGSVWIEHSLSFRSREQLFIASERWQTEAKRHYARLALPVHASAFLTPLLERVRGSLEAVAAAQPRRHPAHRRRSAPGAACGGRGGAGDRQAARPTRSAHR